MLILHGNRLEQLADTVFAYLARHPLAPLEQETLLVQSNGMAEWLKMELAQAHGICAATRVELPARFVWRAYRAVLGRNAVPATSPLDKLPLTWRLMGLLPRLVTEPVFAPVAGFLRDGDPARRLQLAQRLADLYDQYQVYRSDWLHDWSRGQDRLAGPTGHTTPVPEGQQWQPALWRAVLGSLAPEERAIARPGVHRRFLEALADGAPAPALPRRIVLFGTTHIPHQTLEAIAALSSRCQVLMAVPNPCRWHWADIIDGRELLRAAQRRHPLRDDRDLAAVPLQDMHAHGHPLLAAWGRQGRDFVRQLDAFDDVQQARARFDIPRVDLFDEGPGTTMLQQLQADIRDLVPPAEQPPRTPVGEDRSIVFHVAHGAQREVEILHDQLLHLLAHPPEGRALAPRDIVVMVPDIDGYAAAIRSVFGQFHRTQPRHIPWGIADLRDRGHHPLLVTLEWLLRAPQQRFATSELRDLLDVPAVQRRLGLQPEDLPTLVAWMHGAGMRWGLHEAQRAGLGLAACGDANTALFGLRRMLLGYATGDVPGGWQGIEPYAEVAGLAAGLAGPLAELLQVLQDWWADSAAPRTPAAWGERLRALLQQVYTASDDAERALLSALDEALSAWLQSCENAAYDEPVDIAVVRESWLDAVDDPGSGLTRRFKAGGVTFCTLLPLRAIPFEVVCLLGMNDGDYPRRSQRSDFDLMALPGQARPGDRSRRDDDRQLMLDALLSARRVLYVSWAGRSARDNTAQPPSVLVSQLRDHLENGWGQQAVAQRTTEHPLQPFSRRYFDGREPALFTYASEWRAAHGDVMPLGQTRAAAAEQDDAPQPLTLQAMAQCLRNPVKSWFQHRLGVRFDELDSGAEDDELFAAAGLARWSLRDEVLQELTALQDAGAGGGATATATNDESGNGNSNSNAADDAALPARVATALARLQRAGRLPLAAPGRAARADLAATLLPMLMQWQALRRAHPNARPPLTLHLVHPEHPHLQLADRLTGLRSADATSGPVWIDIQASALQAGSKEQRRLQPDKLVLPWLRALAASAAGTAATGLVIGADVWLQVTAPPPAESLQILQSLMQACGDALHADEPAPTAVATGVATLNTPEKAAGIYNGNDFGGNRGIRGERADPCLARLYPDHATLADQPRHLAATEQLYTDYAAWFRDLRAQPLPDAAAGEDEPAGDADD